MIQGVLFDVDGTLVLSNDGHARSWVDAFAEHGYDVPFETVRPLIGMGGDKLMSTVTPGLDDQHGVGKEIAQRRKEIFLSRYAPTLEPAPGSRELVERIKDAGARLVVASSAKSDELETLLKAARVDDLLQERTTSDDADESKPAPDIVDVAMAKIGLPPEAVVMVGDTPYDVESSHRAGIGVIALRCGGWDEPDLSGATAVYDDPADLLRHFDESPLNG